MSDSLWSHGLQQTRLPYQSPKPKACSNSCARVSDPTQSSHPLLAPSPSTFNLSQHQGLFNESLLHIRWPKYWSFSFNISPANEYSGLTSFRMDWFDLAVQETLESLLQQHSSKPSALQCSAFFKRFNSHIQTWLLEKPYLWLYRPVLL